MNIADRRILITHADCPDGIASAMLVKEALPDIEVRFMRYGTKALEELEAVPGMLFVDFTPPRERYEEFIEAGAIVFDHHPTMQDVVGDFEICSQGIYANGPGISGATLAFKYVWQPILGRHGGFSQLSAKRFSEIAGVRDTWQKDSPMWAESCRQAQALRFYGERAVNLRLHDFGVSSSSDRIAFENLGALLLEQNKKRAKELAAQVYKVLVNGKRVGIIPSTDTSDVADLLPDEDIVAGFRYSVEDDLTPRLNVSLRSRGDVDVSAIAKKYGGGGHKNAAGFTVDMSDLNPYDQIINLLS